MTWLSHSLSFGESIFFFYQILLYMRVAFFSQTDSNFLNPSSEVLVSRPSVILVGISESKICFEKWELNCTLILSQTEITFPMHACSHPGKETLQCFVVAVVCCKWNKCHCVKQQNVYGLELSVRSHCLFTLTGFRQSDL